MADFSLSMPQLLLGLRILAGLSLAFWLLMALDRRRWWPSHWSLHLDAAARETSPGQRGEMVVVVPARNEAATIPRTLPRLLKQQEWLRRIVVVDDRSEDRTRSAAERLGKGALGSEKLHVLRVDDRPEDWSGKVWAMQQGLEKAVEGWEGDPAEQWVLFTDADVLHPTTSLSRLLAKAEDGEYDLVSVMAILRADSFAASVLIPAYVYFFQLLHPFLKASDPTSRTAAAAGGCLLVRRSVLEEAGGFESIRDRIVDDLALTRLAKGGGARCWMGLDPDLRSIRVYGSLHDIVALVTRTAFAHLGNHYWLLPLGWLGLLIFFVGPLVLSITGMVLLDPWIATPAVLGVLLQIAHYLPVVHYLSVPTTFAFMLPFATIGYGWMTTISAWRYLRGQRLPWRENLENDGTRG